MERGDYIAVFMTAGSAEEADRIADALVDEGLAACVNALSGCRSTYRWEGRIERDDEVLLIAKTTRAGFDALAKRVGELHSYDVPEVIAVPLEAASRGYAKFIDENTR